jgi:enoyl-CoA hydratase/carnithine racemase
VDYKVTTYEVTDGVAVVTLNRPDRLNAWTARMEAEYRAALAEADGDPDVRVAVVTGAGRGFCAGADTEALTGIVETGQYGNTDITKAPAEPVAAWRWHWPATSASRPRPRGSTSPSCASGSRAATSA